MKKLSAVLCAFLLLPILMGADEGCGQAPKSASGANKANAKIALDSGGLTAEQRNIKERLEDDNKPGAIKHLYVISAYSGQVLIYSTVAGKVTSSGKRLTPAESHPRGDSGWQVDFNGVTAYSPESLGDDGAYGSGAVPYIYWKDTKGAYHQHYVEGGQIVHISDQPLAVKSIVINMAADDEGR